MNFTIHLGFSDLTGNVLSVLRAKIENENAVAHKLVVAWRRISKFRCPFGRLAMVAPLRVSMGVELVHAAVAVLKGGDGRGERGPPRC